MLRKDFKESHVYRLKGDVLYHYHHSRWKLVVPESLEKVVLLACHSKPTAAHLGRTKTLQRLDSLHLWWRGITTDVRNFVRACKMCRQTKPVFRKPPGLMLSTTSTTPWEIVGVDLMGPLPKSHGGHEFLLVAVDHYSKWVEVFPLRKATGKAVACLIVRQLFSRYGAPRKLLSDNGPQFTCKAMEAVCVEWGVEQVFISPYHPQSNWVERVNCNLKAMMQSYVGDDHRTWDIHVAEFAFAMNSVAHATTGMAPSILMTGRMLRTPLTNKLKLDTILPEDLAPPEDHAPRQTPPPDDLVLLRQSVAEHSDRAKEKLTPVNYKLIAMDNAKIAHIDQTKSCGL